MGIFYFNNNKTGIDLSVLRAGIRICDDNELLKKYDKNKNSIFDVEELAKFKEDVEKSDISGDNEIDRQEAAGWAKSMGITSIQSDTSSNKGNIVYNSLEYMYEASAKINATEQIREDANKGLEMVKSSKGGYITQGWNEIKEFFYDDNSENNVKKELITKLIGSVILDILGDGDISLDDLTIQFVEVIKEYIPDFGGQDMRDEAFREIFQSLVGYGDNTELGENISFDRVYKNLTGVEFNTERVNKYKSKDVQAQFVSTINNNLTSAQAELITPFEDVYWDVQNNKPLPELDDPHSPTTETSANCRTLLKGIYNALKITYNGDNEKINEYLTKKFNIPSVETIPMMPIKDRQKILDMAKIVYADIEQIKNSVLSQILGEKTIEQFSEELSALYKNSFGTSGVNIAESFAESQQTGVAAAKIATGVASAAMVIVSHGALTPIIVGTATGILGMPAVTLAEGLSKEGGMTPEDWSVFKGELKDSAIFGAVGFGIGMTSAKIGMALLRNCPQFMSKVALFASKSVEYATDFAMTVLADMVITGDVHLSADTVSELVNIIVGIAVAKKARSGIKQQREKIQTEKPSGVEGKPNEPKTTNGILSDKNHKITTEEMDILRSETDRIYNSDKPAAEKIDELHSMREELSRMPETSETIALLNYIDRAEASLKNITDVENILRDAGFKDESGNLQDEITINDEIADLMDMGQERTYQTKDGEVRIKYDEENNTFIITDRSLKDVNSGTRETQIHESQLPSFSEVTEYIKDLRKVFQSEKYTQIVEKCKLIYENFGVKVDFEAEGEFGAAVTEIYSELYSFRGLNKPSRVIVKKGDAPDVYWDKNTNEITYVVSDKVTSKDVRNSLRHELVHGNDKFAETLGDKFPPEFKAENIQEYVLEMLNAGLTPDEILYAFRNRREFIAVAAQGNMANYSATMRKFLTEKCGMSEECLKMTPSIDNPRQNHYTTEEMNNVTNKILNDLKDLHGVNDLKEIQEFGYAPSDNRLHAPNDKEEYDLMDNYEVPSVQNGFGHGDVLMQDGDIIWYSDDVIGTMEAINDEIYAVHFDTVINNENGEILFDPVTYIIKKTQIGRTVRRGKNKTKDPQSQSSVENPQEIVSQFGLNVKFEKNSDGTFDVIKGEKGKPFARINSKGVVIGRFNSNGEYSPVKEFIETPTSTKMTRVPDENEVYLLGLHGEKIVIQRKALKAIGNDLNKFLAIRHAIKEHGYKGHLHKGVGIVDWVNAESKNGCKAVEIRVGVPGSTYCDCRLGGFYNPYDDTYYFKIVGTHDDMKAYFRNNTFE